MNGANLFGPVPVGFSKLLKLVYVPAPADPLAVFLCACHWQCREGKGREGKGRDKSHRGQGVGTWGRDRG
jgi:hypothetical protein